MRWSDPQTWGGMLPAREASVVIPPGRLVMVDQDVDVRGIVVEGVLEFARRDTRLSAEYLIAAGNGVVRAGTAAEPFAQQLVITLRGADRNANVMGAGTKVLAAIGGAIEFHGRPVTSWTRLQGTAAAGATRITLAEPPRDWRVGDRIAIAPTDYDPFEAETRVIAAIDGAAVTLDSPLAHTHWGEIEPLASGQTIDQRASVGLLSRSITVRGDNAATPWFGAHVMVMGNGVGRFSHVEITGAGQAGLLGRYPIHWHISGDRGRESFLVGSAVHSNFQRGLVVHRTNELQVRDNVIFDSYGHLVFIESSDEVRNVFDRNLVMLTRALPAAQRNAEIGFEHETAAAMASGFWISNGHNRFTRNVVAGVEEGHGYWFVDGAFVDLTGREYELFCRPHSSQTCHLGTNEYFSRVRSGATLLEFRDNMAHTIAHRPGAPGLSIGGNFFAANALMLDNFVPASSANASIQGFRAWKATFYGIWGAHGESNQGPRIVDAIVTDSRGALFNGGQGSGLRPMALQGVTLVKTTRNQPAERTAWSEQRWSDFFHRFNSANDTFWTGITTYPRPRIDFAQPTAPLQGYPAFTEFSNVQLFGWTEAEKASPR